MAISSGENGDTMDIYLLKSSSLTGPWEKVQKEPIISRGRFYEFDYKYLRVGSINYYNGTYFLYYAGQDMLGTDAIGLATTSDSDFPFGWKKYRKNPVFKKKGNSWESKAIVSICIRRIGPSGQEWYGHYSAKGRDRRYHIGICYSKTPYGPFIRDPNNPVLGPGEKWDFGGPARADFLSINGKIYGAYESAAGRPGTFQVGMYYSSSIKGPFLKDPNNPPLSQPYQFANPSLWYENGTLYLLVGRKPLSDHTEYWHYIDLFFTTDKL